MPKHGYKTVQRSGRWWVVWGAIVDQVYNHLELAEQYSVEWAKHCTWKVQGHYCGINGDRILTFQIEKNLIMKLLLSFDKVKEEECTPKQIHLWCKCMIYWEGGGGRTS